MVDEETDREQESKRSQAQEQEDKVVEEDRGQQKDEDREANAADEQLVMLVGVGVDAALEVVPLLASEQTPQGTQAAALEREEARCVAVEAEDVHRGQ